MFSNTRNYVFIYIVTAIISINEVTPWNSPPVIPTDGIARTCHYWLLYHDFRKDISYNKIKSNTRDREFDKDVSFWAAGYAYLLSNHISPYINEKDKRYGFTPSEFCNLHIMPYATFMYVPLRAAEFTCQGWIDFYILDERRDWKNTCRSSNEPITYLSDNHKWASTRNDKLDDTISIWAVGYFNYITSSEERACTTAEYFCFAMNQSIAEPPSIWPFMSLDGSVMSCQEWRELAEKPEYAEHVKASNNGAKKLSYMSIADTKMSCQKWIELHGYGEDPVANFMKAIPDSFSGSINNATSHYLKHLRFSYINEGWILYHKFTNNPEKNRGLAIDRVRKFDLDVSYWAALYAYFLSGFPKLTPITPNKFCQKHGMDSITSTYKTLKDVKKTCEGWIYLYGYPIGNKKLIGEMVRFRDDFDDVYISIWPAIYNEYLSCNLHRGVITPAEFCINMGKKIEPEPQKMEFMSLSGTKMSCEDWIKLSEYIDNIQENIKKAEQINFRFMDYINYWTKKYVEHLLYSVKCQQESECEVLPKTPKDFCESINKPYSKKFRYNFLEE